MLATLAIHSRPFAIGFLLGIALLTAVADVPPTADLHPIFAGTDTKADFALKSKPR